MYPIKNSVLNILIVEKKGSVLIMLINKCYLIIK